MIVGSKIYHKRKCHNSMEWAKNEIDKAPDGAIFIADEHEYTRGRQGRTWKIYPGQLLITLLLKPENLKDIEQKDLSMRLNQLSMALCLGILEPLKAYGVTLKWPNDFIFKEKKLGGVLAELVWNGSDPQGIIVGFAINVNSVIPKNDELFKIATSLRVIFKDEIDENLLLENLIESIDLFYEKWIDGGYNYIYKLWKKNQFYMNKNVTVHHKDGSLVEGLFSDVLPNGDLVLKKAHSTSCQGHFASSLAKASAHRQGDREEEEIIPFYVVENLIGS